METKRIIELLKEQGQIILQGAPGTGKTYATVELAVALCCPGEYTNIGSDRKKLKEKYDDLVKKGQVAFTTFHQSMDYEDFVEGYKPTTKEERDNGEGDFKLRNGIFKGICKNAKNEPKTYCIDIRKTFDAIKNVILKEIQTAGTTGFQLQGMSIQYDFQYVSDKYQVKSSNSNTYGKFTPHSKFKSQTFEDILVKGININKFDIDLARSKSPELKQQGNYGWVWAFVKEIGSRYNTLIEKLAAGTISDLEMSCLKETPCEDIKDSQEDSLKSVKIKKEAPYLLIIDEINRANISKVMGELITLLEKGKREGNEDARSAKLPYSQEEFTVPDNLYIIGTMNTADRSLGSIDYAIRRRFAFVTLEADQGLVQSHKKEFEAVKKLIEECRDDDFEVDEIMVGHSYFMPKNNDEWQRNIDYKIIPLLLEYFKDGVLIDKENKIFNDRTKTKKVQLRKYLDFPESQQIVQKNDNLAQTEQQATTPE